jgi:tetratricopeptide (TPR) repeat protein
MSDRLNADDLDPARLDPAHLDALWDFDDPAGSAERFRKELASASPIASAELSTQLARALGLAGRGTDADAVLADIPEIAIVVAIRLALERGRRLNSSGRPEDAVPYFERALELARAEHEDFLAADAAHMLAIAEPARALEHSQTALDIVDATSDERTKRWGISLHNNLGWWYHDAEDYESALNEFELADAAARARGTLDQQQIARWAIARCYRSLGRTAQALAIQEGLLIERPEDEFVLDEIAALRG